MKTYTPTIHIAFSVPRGSTVLRRGLDKIIQLTHSRPIYRNAQDWSIPWQRPIRAPHSITFNLVRAFHERGFPVRLYSFYEHTVAHLNHDDYFLGMALPSEGMGQIRSDSDDRMSITSRTIREYPSSRNYIILPYAHDAMYVGWEKQLIAENTHAGGGTILIGGDIWKRNWKEKSPLADIPSLRRQHLHMSIDTSDYPYSKKKFNIPGTRGYLYIGHDAWYKNTSELERIAARMPGKRFSHIGGGTIRGWKKLSNFSVLTPSFINQLVRDHDIFVTVSTADPQATTILEQMCLGLAVACTPETGYEYPSLFPLHTHNTEYNVRILQDLQEIQEDELISRAQRNRLIVETQHTWGQFTDSVCKFIGLS